MDHESWARLLLPAYLLVFSCPATAQDQAGAARVSPAARCLAVLDEAARRLALVTEGLLGSSCAKAPAEGSSKLEAGFGNFVANEARRAVQALACPTADLSVEAIAPGKLRFAGQIRRAAEGKDPIRELRTRLTGIEIDISSLQVVAACGVAFGEGFQLVAKPDGMKLYRLSEIEPAVQELLPAKDDCRELGQKLNDKLRGEAGADARFWVRAGPGDLVYCRRGRQDWVTVDFDRYTQTALVIVLNK